MESRIFETSSVKTDTVSGGTTPTTPATPVGRRGFPRSALRETGQVIVEMILVLPIFFLLLFMIMESGNLAFQTIVVHHAAYEAARIGSLVAGCRPGDAARDCSPDEGAATAAGMDVLCEGDLNDNKFFSSCAGLTYDVDIVPNNTMDPQAQTTHNDLEVTLTYRAPLIFPMTSIVLAEPKGSGKRTITARLRMPIESPLFR